MRKQYDTIVIYRDGKVWKIFKSWWAAGKYVLENELVKENDRYNLCEVTGFERFIITLFHSYTK